MVKNVCYVVCEDNTIPIISTIMYMNWQSTYLKRMAKRKPQLEV